MPPSNPCGLVIHGHRGAGAGRDIVSLAAALENRRHWIFPYRGRVVLRQGLHRVQRVDKLQ